MTFKGNTLVGELSFELLGRITIYLLIVMSLTRWGLFEVGILELILHRLNSISLALGGRATGSDSWIYVRL